MKSPIFYIDESFLILERNEKIFPKDKDRQKFQVWIGDHGKQRQEERHVSDKEIISAFFGAYDDINELFKKGEITVAKSQYKGQYDRFVIIDARKDKRSPVCVSAFIYNNYSPNKLKSPQFTVKTVYKGGDFSGATRGDNTSKGKEEKKIFLY